MKKILFLCLLFLALIFQATNVHAAATDDNITAKIGDQFFDTLEEAILATSSTDTISLASDVTLSDTLKINKTVNINLNNHTIEATEQVFSIQGGSLKLSGTGTIRETNPNYGAIVLKGSDDPTKTEFSTVTVDSGVTLEGWSGIFISHNNKTAYGVQVNMNGTINAVNDINGGSGAGIYINGNIQHEENPPIINLTSTSKITSTGNGIYAAGYAIYNINGAYISGEESGLGIKSGVFNILNATIMGTGPDKTPTSGNNNGINASGTAIQIESNKSYKGDIELTIKNGTINSKNSNVIYEYTVNNNTPTKVKSINLSGGTYTSDAGKSVFQLSDSFTSTHQGFITGGTYSSNPTDFLANNYSASKNENSLYEVTKSTMQVFATKDDNNNTSFTPLIIIISLLILGIIIFLNRKKILKK